MTSDETRERLRLIIERCRYAVTKPPLDEAWDALDAHEAALRAERAKQESCAWTQDDDGNWDTACGQKHILIDGTPR